MCVTRISYFYTKHDDSNDRGIGVAINGDAYRTRYSCYNPKYKNLFPTVTSPIFGYFVFEKFLYRPTSNAETNLNPVSKQPRGKHIKIWVFTM